jgi:uncharacterized protein YoxC
MRVTPTQEERREMEKVAELLRELSKKSHEKAVDLTRRLSVLQFQLGERKATGQPVEDLKTEMEEINQKIKKLVALRNRAHGAANEADEFWDKWLREKRQLMDESERAGKYDSSTEKLYRLVRKLIKEGRIGGDEEWWEEVLEFVDDEWVSRFSGLVIWKAIEALRLAKSRLLKAEGKAKRATILERIRLVERYWNDAARLLWSRFRNNVDEITKALSEVKACVATEEFSLDALRKKVNKLYNIATEFLNSEEVQKYINETLEGVREEGLPARFAVGAWCVDEFKSQLETLHSEVQGSTGATEG